MVVFISYRRSDSQQFVDQLEKKLRKRLAGVEVFRDIGGIESGDNWKKLITEKIDTSDIMLVIIGSNWLTAEKKGIQRIKAPNDVVCYEIASALSKGVKLMPVLIEGASFPDVKELPSAITELASINAHVIKEETLKADINGLIKRLGLMLGTTIQEQPNIQGRKDVNFLINEFSKLSKKDPRLEDFESYWRWFLQAKKTLHELSTGTQVESQLNRIEMLLSETKDSEQLDRELAVLEIEATLEEILKYFSTEEEQKIDHQKTKSSPGKVILLPGIDLKNFPLFGNWRCDVTNNSETIVMRFNIANDGTISGSFTNTNGKNRIDGDYLLNFWNPPDEYQYVGSKPQRILGLILRGLLNRIQSFSFKIPIEEKIGRGYKGTDQQGRIFFLEKE